MERKKEIYSVQEVAERLGKPLDYVIGLCRSGLLGYHSENKIIAQCLEQFERYGTQWSGMNPRLADDSIHEVGNTDSALTHYEANLGISDKLSSKGFSHSNSIWISQFYLNKNEYYFLPSTGLALTGNTGLHLSEIKRVDYSGLEFSLFPDPSGFLALITCDVTVEGSPEDCTEIRKIVSGKAQQLVADLSFTYDRSLRVNHEIYINCPQGNIFFEFFQNGKRASIDSYLPESGLPLPLIESKRLYSEALSGSDVFHRFFQLYKAFELATNYRNEIRFALKGNRSDRRVDVIDQVEVIPDSFEYVPYSGKGFGDVFDSLRADYRNALAHITEEKGAVKFMSRADDIYAVWHSLPIIRYMAKTRIQNVISTFSKYKSHLDLK